MGGDLAVELRRLGQQRLTGTLRAGDGIFHIAKGTVASVECRRATGLDRLVTGTGVVSPEEWRRAGAGDPGSLLGRPSLEVLAVLSVFDAAYFVLASPAVPEFRPAPPHWLAPVCSIAPQALVRECVRRGNPRSGPWPAHLVDQAPVVAARTRRHRLTLSAGQTEVLAAADGRRTIAGIARDLGRTTYGCLVAVRDLTAAGLIAAPVLTARAALAQPPAPLPRRRTQRVAGQPPPQQWQPVRRDILNRVLAALGELE